MKDWDGNSKSVYSVLGASNHSEETREIDDYYATHPKATELLLENELFTGRIWEPACGEGHISKVLENHGYVVYSSDVVDRGYGDVCDFLKVDRQNLELDIVTNPPYKFAREFVEKSLDVVADKRKVAMFLKLQFLEGKARKEMFVKYPPKTVYVSSSRLQCGKNGVFDNANGSAVAYAWFVWEKGFKGNPIIKWIN